MKPKQDFPKFLSSMKSIPVCFLIMLAFLKTNTCLRTLRENKEWLMIDKED